MIYPFADKLENMGSKYALVVLAAKRAKQIKSGVPPAIETASRNPLTIALEEIAMGKITCEVADNDLIIASNLEPEVAQLLAIPERLEEEYEAEAGTGTVQDEAPLEIEDDKYSEEESLEEWEDDSDEEEVLPLDKHLENGIVIRNEEDDDDAQAIVEEAPKPKTRGRRKAQPEPDLDAVDIDVEPHVEIDIDPDEMEEDEEEE